MDNPGAISLGDFGITQPATQIGTSVDISGAASLTLQARFQMGGGGTKCVVYVQTSFDQGQTWCDIASFAFATAGGSAVVNLTSTTPSTTPAPLTDGVMADNTSRDGIIGAQLRAKVVSTGAYNNSTLMSVWAVAR